MYYSWRFILMRKYKFSDMNSYSIIKNMYLNFRKRIFELKEVRTMKQVLILVMLLLREGKIKLMF